MDYEFQIEKAVEYIKESIDFSPKMLMILGSGLGELAQEVTDSKYLLYEDIPGFPIATAPGHDGQLVFGLINSLPVVIMQGRYHYYEGYSQMEITFPIRVIKRLGVEMMLLTNAAGSVDIDNKPGDLMLIEDHINFSGQSPLIGSNLDEFGPRFPDMSNVYDKELRSIVEKLAQEQGIELKKGVYMMFSGPQYETPAEIRMARTMGASAVGMSTVPEAVVGVHSGIKVCAISCLSNMAAGILDQPLAHQEVLDTGLMVKDKFGKLVLSFCEKLAEKL